MPRSGIGCQKKKGEHNHLKNYEPTVEEKIFMDANEYFVGDVLNEDKLNELNKLRDICHKLSRLDSRIKYKAHPFSNKSKNAMVMLDFPEVYSSWNRSVKNLFSAAINMADGIITSTTVNGLRVSLSLSDMWTEYHYDDFRKEYYKE